jgi:DNA-binding transcriptional regulator Cro
MKFSEVMAFYDYKMVNIVRELKVARDTVKSWKIKDKIPFTRQCQLEVLSNGKLKASKNE